MILNIRGTSGAGKSHLVKAIMSCYPEREDKFIEGRKRQIGYVCTRAGRPPLWVVGHYETPCGGADTIQARKDGENTMDLVYGEVKHAAGLGMDVLYEGLIIQSDTRRCIELGKQHPLVAIALTTPLADCLKAVQDRRTARGDERILNPANTEGKMKTLPGQIRKLREGGVQVLELSRVEALVKACELLRLAVPRYREGQEDEKPSLLF